MKHLYEQLAHLDKAIEMIQHEIAMRGTNPFGLKWRQSGETTSVTVSEERNKKFNSLKERLAVQWLKLIQDERRDVLKRLKEELKSIK